MSTITRELAKLFRKITNSEIDAEGNAHVVLSPADSLLINNARIALASLEAEAVGEVVLGEYDDCGCHPDAKVVCIAADGQADWENFKDGTRLYTAPPATVSVPGELTREEYRRRFMMEDNFNDTYRGGWNACRAAMLQAGNSPVTPDTWIPVSELMSDKLIPVMVMYEDGEMWSAMWNGNRWDDGTEYPDPHSVTHWQKMPAAPQQEVQGE